MSTYEMIAAVETIGVAALAMVGVLIGRWFSNIKGRGWITGYIVSAILTAFVSIPRWIPQMESVRPFSWLHTDRMEFVVMALVTTVMLTTTLGRLQARQRKYVMGFMAAFTVYFSLLPFAYPAFTHDRLAALETNIDENGVCLQSTNYNCGPAAAVTVLRMRGIAAEEGEIALGAHTNPFAGTPTDSLCRAISDIYSVPCDIVYCENIDELRELVPCIAVVKFSMMIDHYVAVLSVDDSTVIVGDPLVGQSPVPRDAFDAKWRKYAVTVTTEQKIK